MKKDFPSARPVPFKDPYETISFAQEHALGHVVKSPPTPSAGIHPDGVWSIDTDTGRLFKFDDDVDRGPHDHHHVNLAHAPAKEGDHESHGAKDLDAEANRDDVDSSADGGEPVDEWTARRQLVERDRFERNLYRERVRRERRERRAERAAHANLRRRRRPSRRTRNLDARRQRARRHDTSLPGPIGQRSNAVRDWREGAVRSNDQSRIDDHLAHVAVSTQPLTRPVATRAQGAALVLYFTLLPYVVVSKWRQASDESSGLFVRAMLVLLALFWLAFLCQVVLNVRRLRRGRRAKGAGSAWLAGLLVALMALMVPSPHAAHEPVAISVPYRTTAPKDPSPRHRGPSPFTGLASVPMALMAKRRDDLLREPSDDVTDFDVDESIELLRARDPELIAQLASLAGDARDGVLDVAEHSSSTSVVVQTVPIVACSLGPSATGSLVGFAREGGRLPVRPSWSSDDLERHVVALHEGRVLFVRSEPELLRALATRTLRQSVVVYLGPASELDDELSACAIAVRPYVDQAVNSVALTPSPAPHANDLRVELLRADPQVAGLVEPFTATLRRRCVEMVAYLALHRHEPVTGERLRTRVLAHADVDASIRTLANTASAVRRSLGVDAHGPRLHPVSSSGLYITHGLSSDVEVFSTLVGRARQLPVADASALAHQALLLIKGEPLASALRGFEWFLAEGHAARLARDGEWAALALHHESMRRGNYELAFWSLQQGMLIDPYSDALSEALSRVPRLREFGGNGSRAAQHHSVGARGAVAMSWSFARFTQQVFK
jgi:hypothetical protein